MAKGLGSSFLLPMEYTAGSISTIISNLGPVECVHFVSMRSCGPNLNRIPLVNLICTLRTSI